VEVEVERGGRKGELKEEHEEEGREGEFLFFPCWISWARGFYSTIFFSFFFSSLCLFVSVAAPALLFSHQPPKTGGVAEQSRAVLAGRKPAQRVLFRPFHGVCFVFLFFFFSSLSLGRHGLVFVEAGVFAGKAKA